MKSLILTSLVAALLVPSLASGGSAANPAATVGRENFGMTFEMESQVKNVDGDAARSTRLVSKVIWGATDRLDLYARLGASDLRVEVVDMQDYEGKRGMTWGGGARLLIAEVPRPSLAAFVDVQMLSFYTRGTVWRSFAEEPYIERYDDRYKWNELQLSFVAVWQREVFKPYAGFGLTNVFGNVTKNVYRIVGNEEEFYTRVSDNFGQDAIPELILGMDFGIGGTATVSGEIRYSDEGDVSFSVGASELWRLK